MTDTCITMPKTFEDLKYGDLQRYAKKFGIKANMKAEKLIEALTSCAVRNGLITEKQDVQVTPDDPSAESKIEIQNVASAESQSTKPVSLCFGKPGAAAASKEVESGRVSSAKDSKRAASRKVTGNDASPSEDFKVEHSNTAIIDITEEKENAEKKQRDYLTESTFEIALTGYVCERRSKRKRSSDKEVVQNVEDDEVVFNIRENKRHCQIKTPDNPTVAKVVASSGRRRHSTYTVEDAKGETHKETQPGRRRGSVMNCEALSDVKVIGAAQKTSQIPRLNQPTKKRPSTVKAFTAQYWAKLHKRQFDQMDSLDVYVEKKTQRALSLLSPNHANGSAGQERRSAQQKKTALKPVNESSFVPTVFSTTKMNTNFNQMYQNQFPSINKKQPEKAEGGNTTSVGAKVKAEFGSARKSLGNPFNVNPFSPGVVSSAQKSKFNLQASLSRPITWKPYVGKLKESYVKDHHLDVKKVTVKTRDDRRREMKNARAQKRLDLQNERRVTGNAK